MVGELQSGKPRYLVRLRLKSGVLKWSGTLPTSKIR